MPYRIDSRDLRGMRLWGECPTHGRVKPRSYIETRTERVNGMPFEKHYKYYLATSPDIYRKGTKVYCPEMDGEIETVLIKLRGNGGEGTRCGSACLAGKKTCDCKCGGQCHGAGVCNCGNN